MGKTHGARLLGGLMVASLFPSSVAGAQAFELNRFRPAPLQSDGFALSGSETLGHLGFNVALTADYAHDPLVVELATGQEYSVVSHQLALHLNGALGLGKRTMIFGGLPLNALMKGGDPPSGITTRLPRPDGAGLGDLYLAARVRILGDSSTRVTLAGQATLSVPLASVNGDQLYSGDDMVAIKPELMLGVRVRRATLRANLGIRVRENESVLGTTVGDELSYGLGVDVPVHRDLRLIADLFGAAGLESFSDSRSTPLELLMGGKYQHPQGFHAALAAGPGLLNGIGTPDVRAILTVGFARVVRETAPKPEPRDLASIDADGDRLLDVDDSCPQEPEDYDNFEDTDGCPDLDHDHDGLLDVEDRCINEAEDDDDFEDSDGCPELDNDKDGVLDVSDRCPLEAGDAQHDGCLAPTPPPAAEPEPVSSQSVGSVYFAPAQENPLPKSYAVLWRLNRMLRDNPTLSNLQIEGHTDLRGDDAANLALSRRRARAIARWLHDHGVAVERLHIVACGEKDPTIRGELDDVEQNRRVELYVGDRPQHNCESVSAK